MENDALSSLNSRVSELKVTAQENPAVHNCCCAFRMVYAQGIARGDSVAQALSWAGKVYRLSLPPLTGSRNIQDFIACVTHGITIGAIDREDFTKLLYAAQVAQTARRIKNKTKPKKTVKPPLSPPKKPFPNRPSET